MVEKYVSGFNGARDGYQFPLALYESDLLFRHVGDIYLPDIIYKITHGMNMRLSSRHCVGLPSGFVYTDWSVCRLEYLRRLGFYGVKRKFDINKYFEYIDGKISETAASISRSSGANLALYSGYALNAFKLSPDKKKVLFQYHPRPSLGYSILKEDFERFPEIVHSFSSETDTTVMDSDSSSEEFLLADMVLCASSYTKKSLIASGCPERKISVVPYGINISRANIDNNIGLGVRGKFDKVRFIFVGQGVQRKGLHHLLRVWKNIRHLNIELHLVVNRTDPGLISEINSSGAFVYTGLSSVQLKELYSSCDVFVMPSLVEGFGLVYLEALGFGLICIGGVNSGLPDLKLSQSIAKIYSTGDLVMLENLLLDAYEDIYSGRVSRLDVIRSITHLSWQNFRRGVVENIKKLT